MSGTSKWFGMSVSNLVGLVICGMIAVALVSCAPGTGAGPTPAPSPVAAASPSPVPPASPTTAAPAPSPTPVPPASPTEAAPAKTEEATFTDPFAYCAAVGTIDSPDARYTGPKMPDDLAKALRTASGGAEDAPLDMFKEGGYWRCVDGKVYACTVGANLPCAEKANTDRTPTDAENEYCQENPDSDMIPAAVTGHETIYDWHCKGKTAEAGQEIFHVDARGFITEIWYQISGK
jgi:hypothetical protein